MKRFFYLFFLVCVILVASFKIETNDITTESQKEELEEVSLALNTKTELANEVDNYIKTVAPTSLVSADYLVEGCKNYNVDLIFVLAQGTLESHFATKGVGGKINSIFNVCVYDNIKSGNGVSKNYKYLHPDESIEPYLQLLTENYLVDGKTESDLLKNYVNKHGQRYATYPHYEKQMATIMKRIKTTTKIDSLQTAYTSMDTILL